MTVRNHAEQAILKYGSLVSNNCYALSNSVAPHEVLGGLFEKYLTEALSYPVFEKFKTIFFKSAPQWVLTDFSERDIFDVYRIEGLAYQYWYIAAKMRALGKGIKIIANSSGLIKEERTLEQEALIRSFDKRDEENSVRFGLTSNVGTFVYSKVGKIDNTIFCAFINAMHHKSRDLKLNSLPAEFSPNYLPWFINADEYFLSHNYLASFFEKKFKFGLLEFCQVSMICSRLLISVTHGDIFKIKNKDLMFITKFQRGYTFYDKSLQNIKDDIHDHAIKLKKKNLLKESRIEDQIDIIIDFLTLDETKQSNIGIWSNGPKFIFIKNGDSYICDYSAWYSIFKNLFFGLRNYDPQSKKGTEFEYAFGSVAQKSGFDVIMQSKEITCNGKQREIDIAIRIGNNLYLFECRAFERPLNFFIGNPKTISSRCKDLKGKLEQVSTLAEFIIENKAGSNYNFEWANNIYSAVVSPYTEWVWSHDPYLWTIKKDFPRIMSAHEAIKYLTREKSIANK